MLGFFLETEWAPSFYTSESKCNSSTHYLHLRLYLSMNSTYLEVMEGPSQMRFLMVRICIHSAGSVERWLSRRCGMQTACLSQDPDEVLLQAAFQQRIHYGNNVACSLSSQGPEPTLTANSTRGKIACSSPEHVERGKVAGDYKAKLECTLTHRKVLFVSKYTMAFSG